MHGSGGRAAGFKCTKSDKLVVVFIVVTASAVHTHERVLVLRQIRARVAGLARHRRVSLI